MRRILVSCFLMFYINGYSQKKSSGVDSILNYLNIELPELASVKALYVKNRQKNALEELLNIYRSKETVYKKTSTNNIANIKKQFPIEIENSIKIADQVVNKYFVFREEWDMERTNIPYQFKGDIDWQINPFGDPEWTWMLNRHKYWTHLGKAYFFTKNEKYAKAFVQQVEHWISENPINLKTINPRDSKSWRSIEAGIRCENWIKSFEYIKHSKNITPQFLSKFLKALHLHGEYLSSVYSNFSKTSNWGVLENHGLFNLAIFLDYFKTSENWKNESIRRLNDCITLQVLDDGTHWEHSPMYHNEVMHCFLNVNLLAKRNAIKLPEPLIFKTKDMAFANVEWQKPNYHQPLLGDSDDTDTRGLLTLASYVFNDSTLKSRANTTLDFDNYLILGEKGHTTYSTIQTITPNFLSKYQFSSGDFYIRSSWKEDATYTSFHLKKLAGGHAHDDLLSFTIYANKKDYLIDSGRYTYVDNEWRKLLKSNISHNTLGVDDLPNSILKGAWSSTYEVWSEGVFTSSDSIYGYGEASSTAYKRLKNPVDVKRRMLYLKPNVWLVFDSFSTNGQHKFSQYFNFPNQKVLASVDNFKTTYKQHNLVIQPLKKATIKLHDSWYSPEYNLKVKSKRAEIYTTKKGFTSMITLLHLSDENLKHEKIKVYNRKNELLKDDEAEAITLTINDSEYTLLIAYKSPNLANHFFKVKNKIVHGEVVLLETKKGITNVYNIK